MYAGANGRSKPFSDGKVVRGFHTSEQIFAAKRRSEKSGCTSGDTDKPIMRSFVVELVIDNIASDFYYKVLLLYE